jgi:hypothetical protein
MKTSASSRHGRQRWLLRLPAWAARRRVSWLRAAQRACVFRRANEMSRNLPAARWKKIL